MEGTYNGNELHQTPSAHSDDSKGSTSTAVSPSTPQQFIQYSDSTPILGSAKYGHGQRAGSLAQNTPDDSSPPSIYVSDESNVGEWGYEGLALKQDSEQDTRATLPAQKSTQTIRPLKPYPKPAMDVTPKDRDTNSKKRNPDEDFASPTDNSLTRGSTVNVPQGRGQLIRILTITVALYSTIMSGLWFGVAVKRPWWGTYISSASFVGPDNVGTVGSLLAKSIEITFTTTFVAYLGQQLTRKAGSKMSKGISVADLSIKLWVSQPGSMVSHWASFRIAAISTTGLITFLATWSVMLYTSASNTLVTPKIVLGNRHKNIMNGTVKTSFANVNYIRSSCPTMITAQMDPDDYQDSCIKIEHAGQADHNFMQFMSAWLTNITTGDSPDQKGRPVVPAVLDDYTSVTGSWIDAKNLSALSKQYGRTVHNMTLAFPHSGVVQVAHDNEITQMDDLREMGVFILNASVPSPAVNVLCASVKHEELKPMVYALWPGYNGSEITSSNWPPPGIPLERQQDNSTAVDDVFGFRAPNRTAPIFPKLPKRNNTVLAHPVPSTDSVYVLATAPDNSFMMCSLRASLVTNCSTQYQGSMTETDLVSNCEDPDDKQRYIVSVPDASPAVPQPQWVDVATSWANAISLNEGINDGAAPLARILTQLIPKNDSLDPSMPSIAEALAALAGCTLLISGVDAPFNLEQYVPSRNMTGTYQYFNATIQTPEYRSTYMKDWQRGFYVVLLATFAISCYCLFYLLRTGNLLTDITEPQNLFSLAINSPPNQSLGGTYGSRLSKQQYSSTWSTKAADIDHVYFVRDEKSVKEKDPGTSLSEQEGFIRGGQEYEAYTSVTQQSPEFV